MANVPKAANGPRTRRISVPVNDTEYRRIAADADHAGLSISAYVRSRALDDDGALDSALEETMRHIERDLDNAIRRIDETVVGDQKA